MPVTRRQLRFVLLLQRSFRRWLARPVCPISLSRGAGALYAHDGIVFGASHLAEFVSTTGDTRNPITRKAMSVEALDALRGVVSLTDVALATRLGDNAELRTQRERLLEAQSLHGFLESECLVHVDRLVQQLGQQFPTSSIILQLVSVTFPTIMVAFARLYAHAPTRASHACRTALSMIRSRIGVHTPALLVGVANTFVADLQRRVEDGTILVYVPDHERPAVADTTIIGTTDDLADAASVIIMLSDPI